MTVPDYQALMAPALRAVATRDELALGQLREVVAKELEISDEDLQARIPSGSLLFHNRLHWAVTYLSQAGLLRRPRRAVYAITDRGRQVLRDHPQRIDNSVLSTFSEFHEFTSRTSGGSRQSFAPSLVQEVVEAKQHLSESTPEETIAEAVSSADASLAAELLERVRQQEPAFLERLVLTLLTSMGYGGATGAAEHLGRSGDEGLDGVIRQDALGLDRIYVQAKRYSADRAVGRPEIQEFVGALHGAQADRGIFITTSRFSREAEDYAARVAARVVLLDGTAMAELMVQHGVGVQDEQTYVIKKLDEDFFE